MARRTPIVLGPGESHAALREGTIKRIHIRGAAVASCKRGDPEPCVTIQTSQGPFHCFECEWDGPARIIERFGQQQLKSGAGLWIETRAAIKVVR